MTRRKGEITPSAKLAASRGTRDGDPVLFDIGDETRPSGLHHVRTNAEARKEIDELQTLARQRPIALVFAARDELHNEAVVLRDLLIQR
jgi:uncharacterized protein YeaO (DUF488 family)